MCELTKAVEEDRENCYCLSIMRKRMVYTGLAPWVLVALLISNILPFFAVYNLSGWQAQRQMMGMDAAEDSPLGDKILLCTAEGFRWVLLRDLPQQEQPATGGEHEDFRCGACVVASQGMAQAVPLTVAWVVYHAQSVFIASVWRENAPADGWLLTHQHASRAPPVWIG